MTILEAIDRLNSWIRSDSARGWWVSPRDAIYDWKTDAIERAIRRGVAKCSAVHLSLTCRDCGGSKRYTDSSGFTHPHCRKCNSSGAVRLYFAVTEIEGFIWHTPRDRAWRFRLPEEIWTGARISIDWEPNAKGRDLEVWQVAECLNICEEAVARGELCKPRSHGTFDDYEIHHDRYKLDLGHGPRVCELCGRPAEEIPGKPYPWVGIYHGIVAGPLSWSAWGCNACKELYGGNTSSRIFEVLKQRPPVDRMQHPEIQKWLARRMAADSLKSRKEKRWIPA